MVWPSCCQDVARLWPGYGYIVTRVWVTIRPNEYRSCNIIVTIMATDRVMLHFHLKQIFHMILVYIMSYVQEQHKIFFIFVMTFAIYHLRKLLSVGKLKHFDNIGVNGEKRGV